MIMIPSRMPIGRPYGEEMHAQRSDEVKDDGKVSKPVVSKKRIMMECKHLMISEPKLLVGGHQVKFASETPGNWSQVNRRKPGW